jgi:hypothetical protein
MCDICIAVEMKSLGRLKVALDIALSPHRRCQAAEPQLSALFVAIPAPSRSERVN